MPNVNYYGAEGPKRKPKATGRSGSIASRMGAEGAKTRKPRYSSASGSEGPKARSRRPGAGSEGPKARVSRAGLGSEGPKGRRPNPNPVRKQVEYYGAEGPKRKPKANYGRASEGPKSRSPRAGAGAEGPKVKPKASTRRDTSMTVRQMQNKGVKSGTVRTGAGGRTTRKYNGRTGRWEVISIRPSRS